jgi:hypothetical protein
MRRLVVSPARGVAFILAMVLVIGVAVLPRVLAQESQTNLSTADAMRLALNEQVGKRVRIKLSSGQDLEGQVARVGSHAVALTQLTGLEFYNATVSLTEVAAVIVRAPGR